MGKAGEKQKRRPKLKDKKQSERFKETARELGADQNSNAFDRILQQMAPAKGRGMKIETFTGNTRVEAENKAKQWWNKHTGAKKILEMTMGIHPHSGDVLPTINDTGQWSVTIRYED
jgi:hypothetical protein